MHYTNVVQTLRNTLMRLQHYLMLPCLTRYTFNPGPIRNFDNMLVHTVLILWKRPGRHSREASRSRHVRVSSAAVDELIAKSMHSSNTVSTSTFSGISHTIAFCKLTFAFAEMLKYTLGQQGTNSIWWHGFTHDHSDGEVYRYIYPQNQSLKIILCTNCSRWRQCIWLQYCAVKIYTPNRISGYAPGSTRIR